MGYSCAVHCRSKKLQQKMLRFLKKHYHRPEPVLGYGNSRIDSSDPTTDLSYDHNKLALGFDYCCMPEGINHYVYSVLNWIALKVGKRTFFKEFKATMPYVVYDGHEKWPRLVSTNIPKKKWWWCIVDDLGFRSCVPQSYKLRQIKAMEMFMEHSLKEQNFRVRQELVRLDQLWEAQH